MRLLPLLHQVAHLPINTNLLTSYVSVFICQNILKSSLRWSKSTEPNPWYKLYAFLPATVLSNISSFLCLKLCYVSYFLNHLTQTALFSVFSEANSQRCSLKNVFLKISQNLQENTWPRTCNFIKKETLAQVFSCEFCEISKNIFSYRTPPVAASVFFNVSLLLPKRFTLRYLPPPLLYSEVLFLFLILYLGALFLQKKEKKRKKYL